MPTIVCQIQSQRANGSQASLPFNTTSFTINSSSKVSHTCNQLLASATTALILIQFCKQIKDGILKGCPC